MIQKEGPYIYETNSKKWLKRLGIFLGTLILIVVGYVVYVFSSYYRLEDKQKLTITGKIYRKRQKTKKMYRITSGNIGFGAYSDDYSFFMDGGKESRARSKDAVIEKKNVSSYAEAVAQLNPDFMLFQEVDIDGTRSYHVDERKLLLSQTLSTDNTSRNYTFAQNYDSPYLFYPILEPHGKNKSGMLTVSNMKITESIRRSFTDRRWIYENCWIWIAVIASTGFRQKTERNLSCTICIFPLIHLIRAPRTISCGCCLRI